MKAGITGLPFSGKTTLFCALTGLDYETLSRGRDLHIASVKVPDSRLERLAELFRPQKTTYAVMEFFDSPGSAGQTGGIEPKTIPVLRSADSLIIVLDAFREGSDPAGDLNTITSEFILNDLAVVETRLERLAKEQKSGKKDDLTRETSLLKSLKETLESGNMLRREYFSAEEEKMIRGFQFLSLKPRLIVVNISESEIVNAMEWEKKFTNEDDHAVAAICASIEKEIAGLDESDRTAFLETMGISEPALGKMIRLSYESMGLISFFTAGGTDEVRAWTVRKGAKAPECAGVIHSDLERGFIRAETVTFEELSSSGSFKTARDRGVLRIEGKDYVVQDGDVLTIRFSV